jgi:hypothetical protein
MRIGTGRPRNHGKGSVGCFVLKGIEMDKSIRAPSLFQYLIEKHIVIFQRWKLDGQITIHFLIGEDSKGRRVSSHYSFRWIAFDVPESDRAPKSQSQETPATSESIVELGSGNISPAGMLRDGFPSGPHYFA